MLWLGGAAVVAIVAFVVIRLVGFGGGDPQESAPAATLPPDQASPTTPTTTMVPTTTTAPPMVEAIDPEPSADDGQAEDSPTASEAEQAAEAAEAIPDPEQLETALPPTAVEVLRIRDAGDFTGRMTLQCVEHAVRLAWHVNQPYEPAPNAALQRQRERTPAPIGDQGFVRVVVDTFVPAEVDADAESEAPSTGEDPDAGVEPAAGEDPDAGEEQSADEEAAGADPDDTSTDEADEDIAGEQDATPVPEPVLVLEVGSVSGRHTDRMGEGVATGMMRHGCPAPGSDEFAEWTVTVEGHAEVAWELAFEAMLDDESDRDGEAAHADETGDGADEVDDLIGQISDEAFRNGDEP